MSGAKRRRCSTSIDALPDETVHRLSYAEEQCAEQVVFDNPVQLEESLQQASACRRLARPGGHGVSCVVVLVRQFNGWQTFLWRSNTNAASE